MLISQRNPMKPDLPRVHSMFPKKVYTRDTDRFILLVWQLQLLALHDIRDKRTDTEESAKLRKEIETTLFEILPSATTGSAVFQGPPLVIDLPNVVITTMMLTTNFGSGYTRASFDYKEGADPLTKSIALMLDPDLLQRPFTQPAERIHEQLP